MIEKVKVNICDIYFTLTEIWNMEMKDKSAHCLQETVQFIRLFVSFSIHVIVLRNSFAFHEITVISFVYPSRDKPTREAHKQVLLVCKSVSFRRMAHPLIIAPYRITPPPSPILNRISYKNTDSINENNLLFTGNAHIFCA